MKSSSCTCPGRRAELGKPELYRVNTAAGSAAHSYIVFIANSRVTKPE